MTTAQREDDSIDDEAAEQAETRTGHPQRTRARMIVLAAAAVAILLVGAAAGMLITLLRVEPDASPGAGSVDVGFAQDMSVHHLQAVTLAGVARARSTDPSIQGLAFDIESTQQTQVGMMKGWLSLWNQPSLTTGRYMTWMSGATPDGGHDGSSMSGMPADGVATMPGMATQEEIARLRSLSGPEMDIYFLQLMLRHHAGGAGMAQYAAQRAATPQVRALAKSINVSQTAEMDTLTAMLAKRGAEPLR